MDPLEVSDHIVDYDPDTLARRPVPRDALIERLRKLNESKAARIVESLPRKGDLLDDVAVDALLVRVHCELQRLWEEFEHGERLRAALLPIVAACRQASSERPIRVVDVGCGLGFGVRWIAHRGGLGDDVELIGADYNATLVGAANDLAKREGLRCRFVVANAFKLAEPAAIFTSTGVIHHFRGDALETFFREQAHAGAFAMIHFDMKPTWLTPVGARIFHYARMREALSIHDGVRSAARAHEGSRLLQAAASASGFASTFLDGTKSRIPILDIFHALVGVRAEHVDALRAAFGDHAARLGAFR